MKPLICMVGPSASGKTTVANELEKLGYKQVSSYTTREPRYEGETGHIFVSKEEFDKLENIVAYTYYNNHHYCTTQAQLDAVDLYVVDVPGVKTLIEHYQTERPIKIWYFDADLIIRVKRMIERGDSDAAIVNRILTDEKFDWWDALVTLKDYAKLFTDKKVDLDYIDAEEDLEVLVRRVIS